jgi:hypothetical protein
MAWTEKMTEMAIQLFDQGLSATATMRMINETHRSELTRNAVIGKWFRMGMFRMGPRIARERKPRTNLFPPPPCPQMPAALARRVNNLRRLHLEMDKAAAPPLPEPKPDSTPSLWLPLVDLPSNGCRWPRDGSHPGDEGFGFCSLPQVEGRSYCHSHCRRAYHSPQAYMPKRPLFESRRRAAA